jgi:hypothetical protein
MAAVVAALDPALSAGAAGVAATWGFGRGPPSFPSSRRICIVRSSAFRNW